MNDGLILASPNLDALIRGGPACKRVLVRLLWPKIRASLGLGHTAKDVHQSLELDGVEITYHTLCRYIAEMKRQEGEDASPPTATRLRQTQGSGGSATRDPLKNVRRLTEEKPPSFRYSGTLSDKELFGESGD